MNAIGVLVGAQTGRPGVLTQCSVEEATELAMGMAIRGALTTPGTDKPLAIIDMGAGSTDASIITDDRRITSIHLAGAGNMVTLLIKSELGLQDFETAEDIKKYPLAKVESLFHIRHVFLPQ